jgi:2,5-diamino-6-(ribosylamino)-4(3H)-pyrimidinone 5'-phosphate reductase
MKLMVVKIPSGGVGSKWKLGPRDKQPRAVILDPTCRAPLTKMTQMSSKNIIPSPWILCRDDIQGGGGSHIRVQTGQDGKFKWEDILSTLVGKGVETLVIEGGAIVLNDVLRQRIADVVLIAIAPVFLGSDGVGLGPQLQHPEWLEEVRSIFLGRDVILGGRVKKMN